MTKIPFSISASKQGEIALIRITGTIGLDVQADLFRSQIDVLVSKGVTDAHLYINSPGGSVFDASEIVNIIQSAFKGHITGSGGALVASAATYIALHCKTFTMPQNGMFMIHKPYGGAEGDSKDIESYLQLLQKVESQYLSIYKERAKNVDALEKMWNGGDWWMTAQEAKENGFITGITGKTDIDSQTNALIAACGCPDSKLPQKAGMELTAITEILGLASDSTTDSVLKAIATLKGEQRPEDVVKQAVKQGYIKSFEQDEFLTIAQTSPKAFAQLMQKREEQAKVELNGKVDSLLFSAVMEKRILTPAMANWKTMLMADFETANAALQNIEPIVKISFTGSSSNTVKGENRSNWTLTDYREKDPDLYNKLLDKENLNN